MSIKGVCEVLSVREKPVEGRNHSFHVLHQADGHFDSRFNAYLRCEACLNDVYVQVLKVTSAALCHDIRGIVSDSYRAYQTHMGGGIDKLPLTCITSGLAGSDKTVVTDILLQTLENRPIGGAVVDCHCHHAQSAHDLLSEIAEGLRDNLQNRDIATRGGGTSGVSGTTSGLSIKRHVTTNQSLISTSLADKDGLRSAIERIPEEAIAELLSRHAEFCCLVDDAQDKDIIAATESSSSAKDKDKDKDKEDLTVGLTVLMRNAEAVPVAVLGDLLQRLHRLAARRIKVHVISFSAALSALPLQLRACVRALVDIRVRATPPPWEIFDEFVACVVSSRQLPVSLPPALWSWIHEIFQRSSRSVRSALDVVLLAISGHFRDRRSILCMFEEHNWLLEMKLVKKQYGFSMKEQDEIKVVRQLLDYLSAEDISEAGLSEPETVPSPPRARSTVVQRKEAEYALKVLTASLARQKIDRGWFKCLRLARDTCLYPEALRQPYSSDLLWAACKSSREDDIYAKVSMLLLAVKECLPRVPISDIHALIQGFRNLLHDMPGLLQTVHDVRGAHKGGGRAADDEEKEEKDDCNDQDVAGAGTTVNQATLRVQLTNTTMLLEDLGDHFLVWEAYLDMLQQEEMDPKTSYAQLSRSVGTKESSRKREALLAIVNSPLAPPSSQQMHGESSVGSSQRGLIESVAASVPSAVTGTPTAVSPIPSLTTRRRNDGHLQSQSQSQSQSQRLFSSPSRVRNKPTTSTAGVGEASSPLGAAAQKAAAAAAAGASSSNNVDFDAARQVLSGSVGGGGATDDVVQVSLLAHSPAREAITKGGSGVNGGAAIGSPTQSPRLSPSRSRLVGTLQSPLSSARRRASQSRTAPGWSSSSPASVSRQPRPGNRNEEKVSPFQQDIELEGAAMGVNSLEFDFIEIAIEDLVQWLTRAAFVFNDALRLRPVYGVLDLSKSVLQDTLAMANTSLRVESVRGLNNPDHFMPLLNENDHGDDEEEADASLADHDMSVLARIMFESLSAANIFDWYDKFAEDCLEWIPPEQAKKKRKVTGLSGGSNGNEAGPVVDLKVLPCRFMRALSDLESTGLLKVHKGGSEVSRVAYLWMGTNSF